VRPLTAFAIDTFAECTCDLENTNVSRRRVIKISIVVLTIFEAGLCFPVFDVARIELAEVQDEFILDPIGLV
jgi:hypothetical protein